MVHNRIRRRPHSIGGSSSLEVALKILHQFTGTPTCSVEVFMCKFTSLGANHHPISSYGFPSADYLHCPSKL